MKGAARRLAAAVEAMRAGTGTAAERQKQQKEMVQALISLQRMWKPKLLASARPIKKRTSRSNAALFQLLLTTLIVYSGSHVSGSGAGASGSGAGAMGVSLSSSTAHTSECLHRLLCDSLVRAFDFSVVQTISETLKAKSISLYVKVSLIMVVCRLPLHESLPFLSDAVTLANRHFRAVDYYMKQCLVESLAHALTETSTRLVAFHAEALKLVSKSYQNKSTETRIAAAKLLQVIAERTSVSTVSSTTGGAGGGLGGGNANGNGNVGAGKDSGSVSGTSGGGSSASSSTIGVSLHAIMQIAAKGMEDNSPEVRRAYSVVVGVVLAKYASSSSGETELSTGGSDPYGANTVSSRSDDENTGGRGPSEQSVSPHTGNGAGKAKSAFKLHVPGMTTINLPSSLSRRKAATTNFSTVANVIIYFKDMVTSKFLSSNPTQSHGGILAAFSIALCNMFERLPPESIAEVQIREVMDATLAILDYPFALGDLTRARNAVGFALRYGLNVCLTEHQHELLLGAYLQMLNDEAKTQEQNHHKTLSSLVEISHLFHSMGEASVTHALDASAILHDLVCHEKQSVRFQAAVALASLVTVIPYRLKSVLTSCLHGLRITADYLMHEGPDIEDVGKLSLAEKPGDGQEEDGEMQSKAHLYAIQGRSVAVAHILRALKIDSSEGISQTIMDDVYTISEELIESQFLTGCADSVWLTCTRAGWTLLGGLVSMNSEEWLTNNREKLLNLWLKSSVLHSRESSLELLRIEAAVIALKSYLRNYQHLAADNRNDIFLLSNHVLHVYLMATQDTLSKPLKRRGQIARYRLIGWIMDCFSMLPPVYSDSYIVLLDLVAEFTTAQALTSLRYSSLIPANSTYLQSVLSLENNALDMVALSRLEREDCPSPLYSRELNHILGLQQHESALTDTELEVQYLDTFWRLIDEKEATDGAEQRVRCSPFTYVRLVDASVILFGRLFHFIPEDLQLRCLQHYAGALADVRADCDVNVCSLLFAVIAEAKRFRKSGISPNPLTFAATSWPLQLQNMLCEMIASANADVRRGAGEALGILASYLGEDDCKGLIVELEKRLVADKLPQGISSTCFGFNADLDMSILSAGAAFSLACIKRTCGFSVSIETGLIYRFASDCSQPLRTWILHSWSIILESVYSTGGDYEQFVSSTFSLMEGQVLAGFMYTKDSKHVSQWHISTKVALGRIINNVVTMLGPELDGSSDCLDEFYSFWMLLRQDGDARVELEFLRFLEQVVVFSPSRFRSEDLRYILRIVSNTALLNPAPLLSVETRKRSGQSLSSSPSCLTPSPSFGTTGKPVEQNDLVNVEVDTNGWSRSILQTVGLSCIRSLVERDPSLIRHHNLFCLLFSALHVEYNELMWGNLPGLHGMWDVLSFAFANSITMQRNSISALQRTILALLDVECRDHEGARPCLWALFCRSIAIGEPASLYATAKQLMVSPEESIPVRGDPTRSLKHIAMADASSLASAAVAAQVETWRFTKASVGDLIALMPPLSRRVRHFAVECVLRVFELMAADPPLIVGMCQNKELHFDLVATRRYFLDTVSNGAPLSVFAESNVANFLCMYLDEFVTLACQVTTTSAEGGELLMFQCVGLRLLNVLVKTFASAHDPEVAAGDTYLLDPYRAQLSSAIRHALKQVKAEPTAPGSGNKGENSHFYAPLFLEAHGIAGTCVSAHIVQDKVGLGRILKEVVNHDYGHAHFIGDELTRTSLTLANLASVGELLASCVTEAIERKGVNCDEREAIATSPLVKAMINGLSGTTEYLMKCCVDTTLRYGDIMYRSAQSAQASATSGIVLQADESILMTALQVPTSFTSNAVTGPLTAVTIKQLRELHKQYWPKIINAMAILLVYILRSGEGDRHESLSALMSSAILHINMSAHDRSEEKGKLSIVLRSVPLLLRALVDGSCKQDGSSSSTFPALLMAALNTLMLASRRCLGHVQLDALSAMFMSLSSENLALAGAICRSQAGGQPLRVALFDTVTKNGLCPTEIAYQFCDATKRTRNPHAVGASCRSAEARSTFVARDNDDEHMKEVLQFATTGIMLLHTSEEVRSGVVRAATMVQDIVSSIADDHYSVSVKEAAVTLSRASIESMIVLARTLETKHDPAENGLKLRIKSSFNSCFERLVEWLDVDLYNAPGFVMQVVANYAVNFPTSLQGDAERFHADIVKAVLAVFESIPGRADGDIQWQQDTAARVELLHGLHKVVQKLIDARQTIITNRYIAALGPYLVEIVGTTVGYPETATQIAELDEAEKLLRVLMTQFDDKHGSAFVHMLLPRLAALLSHTTTYGADNMVSRQVPIILSRLLLCFAQAHANAFKEAIATITPSLRCALETTLRIALTRSSPGAIGVRMQSSLPQNSDFTASKLDLSRYA